MHIPKTREEWDLFDEELKKFFENYGFVEKHTVKFTSNGEMNRYEVELEAVAERIRNV